MTMSCGRYTACRFHTGRRGEHARCAYFRMTWGILRSAVRPGTNLSGQELPANGFPG